MGNIMKETDSSKILRQVRLYYAFCTIEEKPITPKKAMLEAYIKSHRTFERDLIDLRDAGVVNAVYDRHKKGLVFYRCEFDESVTGARRSRLKHLNRLCTVMVRLDQFGIEQYIDILEDPDAPFSFPDIIAQYEALFPDASIRTRQRDFQILNCVGKYACLHNEFMEEPDFEIKYDKKYKTYIFFIYQIGYYSGTKYIFEVEMIDEPSLP